MLAVNEYNTLKRALQHFSTKYNFKLNHTLSIGIPKSLSYSTILRLTRQLSQLNMAFWDLLSAASDWLKTLFHSFENLQYP